MSYWGNTYMPMIDEIAIDAARSWVIRFGADLSHEWALDSQGTELATDEQAFRYIVECIAEAWEDYGDDPDFYDNNYEKCIFDALVFGIRTILEYDWSTYSNDMWPCCKLHAE